MTYLTRLLSRLALALMLCAGAAAANAQSGSGGMGGTPIPSGADMDPTCNGSFPNPITDFCWSCIFPLKIGNASLLTMGQEDNNQDLGSALCTCATKGGSLSIGLKVSFWEPTRLVESVRHPYCFPTLNGLKLDFGFFASAHGRSDNTKSSKSAFYQVHWFVNPLLFWLEVMSDNSCLEQNSFDLGYITELDPLWSSSELSFILNPDSALFSNLVAQTACAADCVATSLGFSINSLFWCAGCQGSMYPLAGHGGSHAGGVRTSALMTQRMTNKMHREGLMWGGSGKEGLCGYYIQPLLDKQNYKMQLVAPVAATSKIEGKCCQPFGRTTALTGAGKEFIYKGEDFTWQLYRKRSCCQGALSVQ